MLVKHDFVNLLLFYIVIIFSIAFDPLCTKGGVYQYVIFYIGATSLLFSYAIQSLNLKQYYSGLDVLLLVFFMCVLLRTLYTNHWEIGSFYLTTIVCLLYLPIKRLIYIFPNSFSYAIFIINISECIYGVIQVGVYFSIPLRGSFNNSSIYGIILALSACGLHIFFHQKRGTKYILMLNVLLVILSYSRSGMLLLLIYMVSLLYRRMERRKYRIYYCLLGSVAVLSGLVYTKLYSSLGRILIWKASFRMLSFSPILGIGYGNFSKLYMFSQKGHLSIANNSLEKTVADNTYFAFNEPLQIFIECGGVSILFFLALFKCFLERAQAPLSSSYKPLLGLIIISCFFYYSLHIIIILTALIVCISFFSVNSNQKKLIRPISNFVSVFLLILCFYFFSSLFTEFNAIKNWKKAQTFYLDNESLAFSYYAKANQALCYKSNFLYNYGVALYEAADYEKAISVLEQANKIQPHTDTYLYLGKSYENLQNYKLAEKNFLTAQQMVPSKFNPCYLLFHLYIKINDSIQANKIAVKISNMPIKISSKEVFEIKRDVAEFLSSN